MKHDEYKMTLLRQFEKFYNMQPLEIELLSDTKEFKSLDGKLFFSIKRAFETKKEAPHDVRTTLQLYIMMLKQLTTKDIVICKMNRKRGVNKDTMTYKINEALIKYHLGLAPCSRNYHEYVIEKYDLERTSYADLVQEDIFID
jgi:hypothetical protein